MENSWNTLLRFLAAKPETNSESGDFLILAGNSLPLLADEAWKFVDSKQIKTLMIVGGIGHATEKLRKNFAKIGFDFPSGMSESRMVYQYLNARYPLSAVQVILEENSSNSGENALFALQLAKENHLLQHSPATIFLMNDPLLQKRTEATFQYVWKDEAVHFENLVPLVPQIDQFDPLKWTDKRLDGQWSKDYFLSLALGEIQRLHDTESGYGPKGKQFIGHVDISQEVLAVAEHLTQQIDWSNQR